MCPYARNVRLRLGFTLIELLVVIGVIAILLALLLPALSGVRRQADQIQCAAQIRQIGLYYAMYANQFKGKYPHQFNVNSQNWTNWPFGGWDGPIGPNGNYTGDGPALLYITGIVKDPHSFYCPTVDKMGDATAFAYSRQQYNWMNHQGQPNPGNNNQQWWVAYTSYVFWANLGDENQPLPPNDPLTSAPAFVYADPQFKTRFAYRAASTASSIIASDMLGLAKTTDWVLSSNHLDGRKHTLASAANSSTPTMPLPTQGYGGNFLYNDGHVDWKRVADCKLRYELDGHSYLTYLGF